MSDMDKMREIVRELVEDLPENLDEEELLYLVSAIVVSYSGNTREAFDLLSQVARSAHEYFQSGGEVCTCPQCTSRRARMN